MSDKDGTFQRYHRRKEPSLLAKPVEDATDVCIDMQIEMERRGEHRQRGLPGTRRSLTASASG